MGKCIKKVNVWALLASCWLMFIVESAIANLGTVSTAATVGVSSLQNDVAGPVTGIALILLTIMAGFARGLAIVGIIAVSLGYAFIKGAPAWVSSLG